MRLLSRRDILSTADIRRAMFLLTMLCVILSMAASAAVFFSLNGFDHAGVMSVRKVFIDTLVVSALMPAFLCPLVVHRLLTTVRDLNVARAELDRISRTDPLTGLLNRRGFDEASGLLMNFPAAAQKTLALLICDIDHFKRVNDVHGHECGDRALIHVSQIIQKFVQKDARLIAARQGGEEFVIAGAGLTIRELCAKAEELRAACADAPLCDSAKTIPLTISIGTAITIRGEESIKALLQRADAALYKAKHSGRNRVEMAPAAMAEAA